MQNREPYVRWRNAADCKFRRNGRSHDRYSSPASDIVNVRNARYVNAIMRMDLVTAVTSVNHASLARETITLKPDASRLHRLADVNSMKNNRHRCDPRYQLLERFVEKSPLIALGVRYRKNNKSRTLNYLSNRRR